MKQRKTRKGNENIESKGNMGVAHEPGDEEEDSDAKDLEKRRQRKKFQSKLQSLVGKLTKTVVESADAACDQMGKRLMNEVALTFTSSESQLSLS